MGVLRNNGGGGIGSEANKPKPDELPKRAEAPDEETHLQKEPETETHPREAPKEEPPRRYRSGWRECEDYMFDKKMDSLKYD